MNDSLKKLWDTAFERFYCPITRLFYEFVTDGTSKAWDKLPDVSEIQASYPNPCGWGTGMEDAVMNGATALDALVSAHNIGVLSAENKVKELVGGLLTCQVNDKNYGFVARSISPYDGKSHYIESSRDQYTHFVYSLVRYYFSPLADDGVREKIRRAVVAVAQKCKREVICENDFQMLREDGTVGKVNKMWGDIGAHERMRLPMFYLAAFALTGESQYESLYHMFRDEALEKSLAFDKDKSRLYCSLQMMCSLRAVYDYDSDESFRNKLLPLMKELAEYGEKRAITNAYEFSKPERKVQVDYAFKPWRQMNMRDGGDFGGYRYLNPGQSELKENVAFYPVREVGEGALLAAMCPERRVSDEVLAALVRMADAIDVKKHSSVYSLLYMPCAYSLCMENRMNFDKKENKNESEGKKQ